MDGVDGVCDVDAVVGKVVILVDCSPIWQPQSTGQRSCPTSVAHAADASTASALLGQYTLSTRPSGQADSKGVFIVAAVDAVETVETVDGGVVVIQPHTNGQISRPTESAHVVATRAIFLALGQN